MDVEDYIDIVRRHKGWIVGPMLACLVIGVVTAYLWPDTYVSSATIRVTPPQVPENFVKMNVNQDTNAKINTIYQSVTSRTTLTNIINLHQLYPRDRLRLPLLDVIERMKKDIGVRFITNSREAGPRSTVQAFEISFSYENRIVAQRIVNDLVSRFIDENVRVSSESSTQTTDFLREQLELRKRELDEVEEKLTKFRVENQGRLPEERSSLQSGAAALENRISNINQGINRATQDKMLLETRLTTLKEQMKQVGSEESPAAVQQQAKNDRLASIEQGILRAETELEAMRQNYRENHPDMRRMMANIAALKRTRDNLMREEEAKKSDAPADGPAQKKSNPLQARQLRGYEAEIAGTQSLIEARNMEIENYQKELQAAERNLRQQQGRLEGIPASVSEYDQLLRERMIAQAKYEEATKKAADSQMSTEVQRRKQGENLELLDPASLPLNPTQPKRPMIIGAAAGIGLVIGLFLAGAREMKDTTLKNLKDVRAYTQLVVLGSIPLIENDLVLRRRKRLAWLAWSTACLAGVAIMAGSVIFYYATKV